MKRKVISLFQDLFDQKPLLAFAPGRVNLIGEHTDYQEGLVFPAAVEQGIYVAIAKNQEGHCRVHSMDFKEEFTFSPDSFSPKKGHWGTYVMGMMNQLRQAGFNVGSFDMVIGGNIPVGAGLSSSAALSVGIGTAISSLFGFTIPKASIAVYAQKSEHLYAGVNCGIMDPYASTFGKKDHALLLDCRKNTHEEININLQDYSLLLVNTKVKHSLADSAYNDRRATCEESVSILQKYFDEIKTLRDIPFNHLDKVEAILPFSLFPKAKHVISENQRVIDASDVLQRGDLESFGKLLFDSHQSLSRDYEVSCVELDFLVSEAKSISGILGARMMGGGFGGCTLNLIETNYRSDFVSKIKKRYQERFQLSPEFIPVELSDGAKIIS